MFNAPLQAGVLLALTLATQTAIAQSTGFSLKGTMWERASNSAACKPDPLLLFSVALTESRAPSGRGRVAPHPFALRNAPSGSRFPRTYQEAVTALERYIREDRLTDIGIMQINYRWNGNRVARPEHLLDPETNIRVGAQILCESIARSPTDLHLAIGGYHTRNPRREHDARQYARNVLGIWRSLQRLQG